MALKDFGAIFIALFVFASARFDIKSNLQSGYETSYARLQELAQIDLKNLAEDSGADAEDQFAIDSKARIPASADEWKAPADPWVLDTPKIEHLDEIFFGYPGDDSTNLTNPPQRATLAWPKEMCPPAKGWPALITIPGRKNQRTTMQYLADLMAGKARITFNIDMKDTARLKDINSAITHLYAYNITYNINTDDISMFGYSLGAITLASCFHKEYIGSKLSAVAVASGASFGNIKQKMGVGWTEGKYKQAPPSLIIHCTDDGLVPYFAKKTNIPPKYVDAMKDAGLKAHGLFYDNGCYHHPFKNLGFFDQLDLFLKDPLSYEPEVYADPDTYTAMMENFVVTSDSKGCADNNEGIEPFKAFSIFNQLEVCMAACYQQTGCTAIDFYKAFPFERPTGYENCFLFKAGCTEPLFDTCTNKKKCPQSYHMAQDPSVFTYKPSLAQLPKAASIQRHGQNLRGSAGAKVELKKVRTRTPLSCPDIEYEEENVETTGQHQKSLFVTLEAADSSGCEFEFTDFGGQCEKFKGRPTGITNALTCETASAHLEGYSFAGQVEESEKQKHPPGCFLKKGNGEIKYNPSLNPIENVESYAFACQKCEVMLSADVELKHYVKTPGDTTNKSYCEGEYELGVFDIFNNKDCAAECDKLEACTHFALCTIPQDNCCRLSASCTKPYTSASSSWNGFLKKSIAGTATALQNFVKTAGSGSVKNSCGLAEYKLGDFDTEDPAECAAKCEGLDDCTSFMVCTDSSVANGLCCRLSSICMAPYTHSDPLWDGYMSKAALTKTDDVLRHFKKTAGSNSENSYCTGSYDLAEYEIHSATECAGKCLARAGCTHFKLCTDSQAKFCCSLSSTCALPYTTASDKFDGYLNLDISRFKLAADSSPVVTERETFEQEPLCSKRTAAVDLTGSAVTTDYPDGGLAMKFAGVTQIEDEPVDLVITSKGTYSYGGDGSQKKKDGGNGIINLKLGTATELTFRFLNSKAECVPFDEIHFTALDINQGKNSGADEIWEFFDIAGYVTKPDADIEASEPDDTGDGYADLILKSTSTNPGWCGDKSIDAKNLESEVSCEGGTITYSEEKRAALVVYKRTCEFDLKLSAPGDPELFPSGKNFFFTFGSELAELCD